MSAVVYFIVKRVCLDGSYEAINLNIKFPYENSLTSQIVVEYKKIKEADIITRKINSAVSSNLS